MVKFIPFLLDIAPEPYGGDASDISPAALAILIGIVAAAVIIGVISIIKAVKSEKKAREMQESAGFASELLKAVNEAQNAAAPAPEAQTAKTE